MRNKITQLLAGTFFFLFVIPAFTVKAQGAMGLRINEVLVNNVSNYEDDYGERSPWIEIVNSTYSHVDIGGCYLTNDLNNPKKYWIPVGTAGTAMPPEGYVIFFADNKPTRGVFHLNFDLRESGVIALFDANGKTMIDKVEITGVQKPDTTYARVSPEENKWIYTTHTTPGSINDYSAKKTSGEEFVEYDPTGGGMTAISMFVVFSALVILFLAFTVIFRLMNKPKKEEIRTTATVEKSVSVKEKAISGEVNAAIAASLYLYQNEMHDLENTVLTVKKVARTYSPWSSKIYMLRKSPR